MRVVLNDGLEGKGPTPGPGECLIVVFGERYYGEWQLYPDGCGERPMRVDQIVWVAGKAYPGLTPRVAVFERPVMVSLSE